MLEVVKNAQKTSIKWNGAEVHNPLLTALLKLGMALGVGFVFLVVILMILLTMLVLAIVIPLSVPLHFLLKLLGRRGFVVSEDDSFSYEVTREGFRKREDT